MAKKGSKSEKENENDNENSGKKSESTVKIIIISMLIFIICTGAMGYFLVTKNIISFGGSTSTAVEKPKTKVYVDLGEFTVNLNSNDSKSRFMKCKINIGYDKGNGTAKKRLTKEYAIPIINDVVLEYMSKQTYDYLVDSNNKEKVKEDLIDEINSQLTDFQITDLRFSEYVLQ